MNTSPLALLGFLLLSWGFLVSILFWVPRIVNRPQLRKIFGTRYPMIYFIYFSNGPFLVAIGLYLLLLK